MEDLVTIIALLLFVVLLCYCTYMYSRISSKEQFEINNKIYTFQELDALKTTVNFSRTLVNDPQCKNSIQYCFNTIKECNNENLINNEPCKTSLQFCKVLEENKLCNASEDEVQDALKTTSDEQMDKIIEAGKILQK